MVVPSQSQHPFDVQHATQLLHSTLELQPQHHLHSHERWVHLQPTATGTCHTVARVW